MVALLGGVLQPSLKAFCLRRRLHFCLRSTGYGQVATGTKCSYTNQAKRATCSDGSAGNCGPMTLGQCLNECINAGDCTHFSQLNPSGSGTCMICRELPDEEWPGSTTYSVVTTASAGTYAPATCGALHTRRQNDHALGYGLGFVATRVCP